jgi:hypothetical protein
MSVSAEVVPKVNKTTNIKEYKKEHYQKNKEYILTFHKQRVKCEKCGKDLAYSSKSSHLKNNRCKVITLTEDNPKIVGMILSPEGEKIIDEQAQIVASNTASSYDKNVAIQKMFDAYIENPSLLLLPTDFQDIKIPTTN